jgi:Domain of unknown function (DUF397)
MPAPHLSPSAWRKSSRSNGAGGECVEVARTPPNLAVRDSKRPDAAVLSFTPEHWSSFLRDIKAGHHDPA